MSLRTKIAIGVLTAAVVLAVALSLLGLEAHQQLREAAAQQRAKSRESLAETRRRTEAANNAWSREQRERALRAVEDLVVAWVGGLAGTTPTELGERLRDPDNGFEEAGLVTRERDGSLDYQPSKPAGSSATLGPDEEEVARRVLREGRREFLGDILFMPYAMGNDSPSRIDHLLRLRIRMPQTTAPELPPPVDVPEVEAGDFSKLAVIGFITLALSMFAVFATLTLALRRFVLAPMGNVLENAKLIVKGDAGLDVRGKGTNDEVETLVAAFNSMFAELKAYQSDLEGKVSEATRTIQRQQQSLVIAQRLAATGTLAAGLAHEVNNPLSGMINAARRLKQREGIDERARDYVALIEEGLHRIEELMKQILDFSRRRDMKPERFDAANLLKRSLPLVKHRLDKKSIALEEDVHGDLPPIYGNEEEVSQVLMNLLINAADAAPEGGIVRVSIQRSQAGGVQFAVEDSGTGVPDEIRDRIFDPFFTTKEPGKGTGLGLSIVHTIVSNHGGQVRVEASERLKGARFVVELPPAEKESTRRISAG